MALVMFRGFRWGVTGARPSPHPRNLEQLTDELQFFPHFAKLKWHEIYLITDSEIILPLTALAAHFILLIICNTDRLD